ncbi:unnamed protein product [Acanthocheilonema viteae]|uniref:Uncharacterized protein n=1 Tax=Acanthocheilonema viteae TaxID=6277 RepID=A0A498SMC0_ACAVI|nr:unnamed protein product [Acanthocheilonema viteae]
MPNTKRKKQVATIKNDLDENHITRIERMAEIAATISGTPSPSQIAAILYLRDLNNRITLDQCRTVIDGTSNEFVICAMIENAVLIILKKWAILEPSLKKDYFDYFLGCALFKHRKSTAVRKGMIKACAKLLKRSVFDGHACNFDLLAAKFYVMLTDENVEFHHITYEFFLKILDEFDEYWRIADLGISYDFQYRAKLSFELSMTEHFLRISNIIFSRNFGIHHLSRKSGMSVAGPPKTWRAIFLWKEFLQLFFILHRFLRNNNTLSTLTTSCITQLMSISNVVLPDVPANPNSEMISIPDVPYTTAYNRYTSDLLSLFVWTFNTQAVMPDVYTYSMMISNILANHSIHSLARAEASFATFLSFIPLLTESFTLKLSYMSEKSENEEGEEKDEKGTKNVPARRCNATLKWAYISALQNLFKGWLIVLQNSEFIVEVMSYAIDFAQITILMISAFMQMIFSIPFGEREEVTSPLPDREIFKEILIKIGLFSSYYLDEMLSKIYTILAETLEEFLSTLEIGMCMEDLENFRENMHWILLIIGHVLVEEDEDRNYVWQSKLLVYYDDTVAGSKSIDVDKYASYMEACINTPQLLTDPSEIDLVIKIVGTVFAWCSIEDTLLKEHGMTAISVELCNTSLWCMRRLLSAIGLHIQKSDKGNQLAEVSQNITQILVDFALQKSFRIFNIIPDEKKTCMDAVELLSTLAHTLYCETSKSIFLFSYLSTIKTDQISVRSSVLKALLQIGGIVGDEVKQKTLYEMILIPIRTKFMSMCENWLKTDEKFDDLLECFCVVADGIQKCSAEFLLAYLKPILKCSVSLLSMYKNSTIIVNAVLQLFDCLTKRIYVYCDSHQIMSSLYGVLLSVIQTYEKEQNERYRNLDDKEKASELVLLLEILTNILDKRNRPVNLLTGKTEFTENRSRIIVTAWNMIIRVVEPEHFKTPLLRRSFYRYLRYSAEMTPEFIMKFSQEDLITIVEYLNSGLQADHEKDDLLCNLKDRFEKEVSINSALAIAHLGTYFTKHPRNGTALKVFSLVIEPTFTICLNALWQEDVQSSATSAALYSLLCCDEDGCKTYVKNLLSREANHPNRSTLRNAFRTLMFLSPGKHPNKCEKRKFHDRLKQFLTKIEGLLVVF